MKIDYQHLNGFRAIKALERLNDSRIDEIEGAGMDEGRVFIHLNAGYIFALDGTHLKSVGSISELNRAIREIEACACDSCIERLK